MAANYTGYPYDTVIDFYYAEARFYDAANRTWISRDPAKDGLNWYEYAGSNPTTYWDPTGLDSYLFYDPNYMSDDVFLRYLKKYVVPVIMARYGYESEDQVHLIPVESKNDFASGWNGMDDNGTNIETVAVFAHSNYEAQFFFDRPTTEPGHNINLKLNANVIADLDVMEIDNMIIWGCNSGHAAWDGQNLPSAWLAKHNIGQLFAADGTINPYYDYLDDGSIIARWAPKADETWERHWRILGLSPEDIQGWRYWDEYYKGYSIGMDYSVGEIMYFRSPNC